MQIDLDDLEGDDESKPKMVYTLASNGGALDAEQIDIPDKDFSNIELYYNHGVVKKVDKLIKNFHKNNKGIGLIFGPRGCGKTNLIHYIISNSKKNVVIIPICFVDFIINPEFRNIIKKMPNTLFVIDDSEVFITDLNTKSNIYINNFVQLVDGIQSDTFPVNILCVSNLENVEEIDVNLLECNNLISCIECGPLENKEAKKLCESIDKKFKSDEEFVKLSDIFNKNRIVGDKKEMGF